MKVPGSPRVKPWHNGFETITAGRIGELVAAIPHTDVVVLALCIGVPEVEQDACYWLATP